MTLYKHYNPNPAGRSVGDCAVRAVAKALGVDWETAYAMICAAGYDMCDMPSADSVWGSILRSNGFVKETISNQCPDCYNAGEFADDHPTGTYVLGFGNHTATVKDGILYDSWDSSREIPIYLWERLTGGSD